MCHTHRISLADLAAHRTSGQEVLRTGKLSAFARLGNSLDTCFFFSIFKRIQGEAPSSTSHSAGTTPDNILASCRQGNGSVLAYFFGALPVTVGK